MIQIENKYINSNEIEIHYTADSGYHESHFARESLEAFIEMNGFLNLHEFKRVYDGHHDEVEGTLTMEQFLENNLTDDFLVQFLHNEMKKETWK